MSVPVAAGFDMGAVRLWEGRPLIVDGKIAIEEDCCCFTRGVDCPDCTGGIAPAFMDVKILGTVADDNCSDCADWTDQWFTLPQRDGSPCEWWGKGPGSGQLTPPTVANIPCAGTLQLQLIIVAGNYHWTLSEWEDSVIWRTDPVAGETADCTAQYSLPYREDNPFWCDWSAVGNAIIRPG